MAHRNSPRTYFMCGSKNFRCVLARVCVDGGGSPTGQTDSRRNSEKKIWVGVVFLVLSLFCWGDQWFFQRKLIIELWFAKIPELQTFPLNLRFSGGGWGWGGVRTLVIENFKFNGKNGSSRILANHSFFAHLPGLACLFTYTHTDSRVH